MNTQEGNVIYDERIPTLKQHRKQRKNKLFITLIFLFFSMIILLLYFQSALSKIQSIEIEGNLLLPREQVLRTAQLQEGMSFFNFSVSNVQERLESRVEIQTAQVERVFPNHVRIQVQEQALVGFWNQDQELYPVLSTGHILLQRPWASHRILYPILTDWPTKEGVLELSQELAKLPDPILRKISEIRLTPIVSDPYRLTLYMDDGNEVRTSIRKFAERVSWYPYTVEQRNAEGLKIEGIYHLFDAKWYEDPDQTIKNNKKDSDESF